MHSDAFKRRLAFSFAVIILALNNFLLQLKGFITKALEYKAVLKFKNNLYICMELKYYRVLMNVNLWFDDNYQI